MKPLIRLVTAAAVCLMLSNSPHAFAGTVQDANKALVLDFYKALEATMAPGMSKQDIRSVAEKFLAPDYRQHGVFAKQTDHGREDFIAEMSEAPAAPPPGASQAAPVMSPPVRLAIMAEGDEVILVTQRTMALPEAAEAKPSIIFNMFRVRYGKLAEHWDAFGSLPDTPR